MSAQPQPAPVKVEKEVKQITAEQLEAAQICLDRAKITILTRSIFLASISFELRHYFSYLLPTAGTDGLSVLYNPDFFMALSRDEQCGLVAHEIWHVAFDHMGRRLDRDPRIWNEAGDYVINALLIKAGFTLPKNGLYNPNWANLCTDDIYDILYRENPQPQTGGIGMDIHLPGSLTDGHKGGTSAEIASAQQKTTTILSKAQTAAEMHGGAEAGSIPGEIKRAVEELLNPVIPWNQYLQRFLSDITKNDYTWRRPNRRFLPDFYLPSQGTPTIGNVVIAVDTSGSISKKQLQEIYSEIENIRATFSPQLLTLIGCDRVIQDVVEVYEHDDIRDIKLGGGGGTSFRPVLDYCDENTPSVLLYFTDLHGETITDEPGYPTLWVCYSDHKPQGIGDTIRYHPEHN